MSDEGARRMKRKYPLFDKACEDSLERAKQGLVAIAYQRAVEGRETVIIRKGEEYERRIQPSDAMLSLLLKRGDMAGDGAFSGEMKDLAGLSREEVITWPEWRDERIRFTQQGRNYEAPDPAETNRLLEERCPCCEQKLPEGSPQQSLMAMALMGVIDVKDFFKGIPIGDG